jgi:hypothetical protein
MPKQILEEPYNTLEKSLISALMFGHNQLRPDLDYPESFSDMQSAVRELMRQYEVIQRPVRINLPIQRYCKVCGDPVGSDGHILVAMQGGKEIETSAYCAKHWKELGENHDQR